MMNTALKLFGICIVSMAGVAAQAQGVEIIRRSYQEAPTLPIAPAAALTSQALVKSGNRASSPVAQVRWEADRADLTIRKVLDKWSASSGWTFGLDNWGAERDLPVMAKFSHTGDFRGAVRGLLASTDLTDMPLQPCFYSNFVLRIVPRAELCDRTAGTDK